MTPEQIKAVVTVAETGSISQAAERLFVTQQSLSAAIIHLEQELGMTLLVRASRGVRLTAYGELFVQQAKEVLAELDELARYGQSLGQKGQEQRLGIYASPVVNRWLLPACLERLNRAFPQCRVALWEEAGCAEILMELAWGEQSAVAVVCVVEEYFDRYLKPRFADRLDWCVLLRAPLAACVSAHSPLAGQDSITLAQFLALPLVSSGDEDYAALCRFKDDWQGPLVQSRHRELLAEMVREGMAASLYPSILSYCDQPGQRFLKGDYQLLPFVEGLHELTLLIWVQGERLPVCAQELACALEESLRGSDGHDD